jgi:hypothetical protein
MLVARCEWGSDAVYSPQSHHSSRRPKTHPSHQIVAKTETDKKVFTIHLQRNKMKIKKGFELREVCGENIIVAYGIENIDFNKVISLNESATFLWKQIADKEFDADTMASLLCQEYEVDEETAKHDAQALLDEWTNVGLVE